MIFALVRVGQSLPAAAAARFEKIESQFYGEEQAYRQRCERLQYEEHDLRDRLAYAPYGEERERLQYRLGQIHTEREQCWRR